MIKLKTASSNQESSKSQSSTLIKTITKKKSKVVGATRGGGEPLYLRANQVKLTPKPNKTTQSKQSTFDSKESIDSSANKNNLDLLLKPTSMSEADLKQFSQITASEELMGDMDSQFRKTDTTVALGTIGNGSTSSPNSSFAKFNNAGIAKSGSKTRPLDSYSFVILSDMPDGL